MNEKKISVNFGMIRRDVLRHWPIWVMASVWYLLFVFMVNTTSRYNLSLINIGNKISENIMISLTENTAFLAYFLGFAAAIAAFGFLGKKKNDNFFEALPFNRASLYVTRYIFGFIMWLIPCLFIFIVEIFQSLVLDAAMFTELLEWLVSAIIAYLFWYSLGILFMVLCGRVVMAGVCYFGFSAAGIVMSFGIDSMNKLCFIGYNSGTGFSGTPFAILSPLEYIFSLGVGYKYIDSRKYIGIFDSANILKIFVVLFAGIIMAVLAYLLYKKRKSERTGDNIVFSTMKVVFSYVLSAVTAVTMTFMLTLIIVYHDDRMAHRASDRIAILIILCIVGFITFLASVMWVERKFKIFTKKNLLKAAVFTVILAVCGVGYMHDFFNVEGYVPKAKNVSNISIPNNNGLFPNEERNLLMINEAAIEKTIELHEIILEDMYELESFYDNTDAVYYMEGDGFNSYYFNIYYTMKNDMRVSRSYEIIKGSHLDNKLRKFIEDNKEIFEKEQYIIYDLEAGYND
ncbi:MAG: hypothetical protein IKP88_12820 [Lachnospiraceae bacterium]|nr:hypothetical protein [Lachnospiraceae bacterium]